MPTTAAVLRQYALHYLFTPSPPQAPIGSTDAPAPVRNIFKFTHPANALDRDRIVIPAGWDSWGKIKILRDDFEPVKWADAWDKDMESFALAPANPSPLGSATLALPTTEATLAPPIHQGARSHFTLLVGPDRGPPPRSLPAIIQPTHEQAFLQQHYETLAKDPGRDPRGAFKNPAVAVDGAAISSSAGGAGGVGVGVVGPLGSSSFSLPSVEKALVEMEGGDRGRERPQDRDPDRSGLAPRTTAAAAQAGAARGVSTTYTTLSSHMVFTSLLLQERRPIQPVQTGGTLPPGSRPLASPPALSATAQGGQTQHEVIRESTVSASLLTSHSRYFTSSSKVFLHQELALAPCQMLGLLQALPHHHGVLMHLPRHNPKKKLDFLDIHVDILSSQCR